LRLKILEKLRTASLNTEFTGSYKKVYCGDRPASSLVVSLGKALNRIASSFE